MAIFGHVDDLATYQSLIADRRITSVVDQLQSIASVVRPGDFTVDSEKFTAVCIEASPVAPAVQQFESHNRIIDVHCCLGGEEFIYVCDRDDLSLDGKYNRETDVALWYPPGTFSTIHMKPGMFAVFFPRDAHQPLQPAGADHIKKVVIKIPVKE